MERHSYRIPLTANLLFFIRWTAISLTIGLVCGLIGTAFGYAVSWACGVFASHRELLFAMPAAGLLILLVYHVLGEDRNRGTNAVLESIYSDNHMRKEMAPAVFIGSVLTHLTGGSAGREGAALQMGGSMGSWIGRALKLDDQDLNVAVMCGMSGMFAALFGTPMAAAIFSMEVISVGVIYYAALVPCIFSAFFASYVAKLLKLAPTAFAIGEIPPFEPKTALLCVALAFVCAAASILFCVILTETNHLYGVFCRKRWMRPVAGGVLIILMTLVFRDYRYNNTGGNLIMAAIGGESLWADPLLKMIFTAVTLEAGYKGGEIVPSFAIGASIGSLFAGLCGMPSGIMAACGMLALFAGVTNAPISSLLIGFEMFGYDAMPYFALVVAISFTFSGYYSLYASQKIVYDKTKAIYINRHTNHEPIPGTVLAAFFRRKTDSGKDNASGGEKES